MTGRARKPQSIGHGHASAKIIYNIYLFDGEGYIANSYRSHEHEMCNI